MSIEKRLSDLRADVQSDRLSMSIGELAGIYQNKEMDIHPKFQRVLRWSREQKTRLIESLLLRIPIPPIFVAQAKDGSWDVVDGVQRLGTIFEFLGILKDSDGKHRPPLILSKTILLPELEDLTFEPVGSSRMSFSQSLRLDFRRSRLDLHIILKESTPSSKYELFERLNTGGAIASPQEVRNCVLVWMNEKVFDRLSRMVAESSFVQTTPLSDRLIDQQYRMELLLRFGVLYNIDVDELRGISDLSDFLNERNRVLANSKTRAIDDLERVFSSTFRVLSEALGGDAFRKYDEERGAFSGPFLISAFEAVALGVADNIEAWMTQNGAAEQIRNRIKNIWQVGEFTGNIGTGISSSSRMIHTVPLGRQHFKP